MEMTTGHIAYSRWLDDQPVDGRTLWEDLSEDVRNFWEEDFATEKTEQPTDRSSLRLESRKPAELVGILKPPSRRAVFINNKMKKGNSFDNDGAKAKLWQETGVETTHEPVLAHTPDTSDEEAENIQKKETPPETSGEKSGNKQGRNMPTPTDTPGVQEPLRRTVRFSENVQCRLLTPPSGNESGKTSLQESSDSSTQESEPDSEDALDNPDSVEADAGTEEYHATPETTSARHNIILRLLTPEQLDVKRKHDGSEERTPDSQKRRASIGLWEPSNPKLAGTD